MAHQFYMVTFLPLENGLDGNISFDRMSTLEGLVGCRERNTFSRYLLYQQGIIETCLYDTFCFIYVFIYI